MSDSLPVCLAQTAFSEQPTFVTGECLCKSAAEALYYLDAAIRELW
jgi:hypothetical protein